MLIFSVIFALQSISLILIGGNKNEGMTILNPRRMKVLKNFSVLHFSSNCIE